MSASTLCTIIEGTMRPVQNVRGLILKLHFPLSVSNKNRKNAEVFFLTSSHSYSKIQMNDVKHVKTL